MITKEEYEKAISAKEEAQKTINDFLKQRLDVFEKRLKENPVFTDDELRYSRETLCPCGHGVAYPKDCGPFHYWDCSAILKGIEDKSVKHCPQMPFTTYEIKSEIDGQTTRGVFRPKTESCP